MFWGYAISLCTSGVIILTQGTERIFQQNNFRQSTVDVHMLFASGCCIPRDIYSLLIKCNLI